MFTPRTDNNVLFRATSWEKARDECLSQGADLAEMNNIQEHRAVNQFLNDWREYQLNG